MKGGEDLQRKQLVTGAATSVEELGRMFAKTDEALKEASLAVEGRPLNI